MSTEYKSTTVAIELEANHSRDTWALADAVLADAPEMDTGRKANEAPAGDSLEATLLGIANELTANDCLMASGEPYSVNTLRVLRMQAMQWTEQERSPHASYKTHREAGGRGSVGRAALTALTRVADGEKARCPDGVDPLAFAEAVTMVQGNERKRHRVTSNALRTAMQRRTNLTPNRQPITSIELHKMLADTRHGLGHFAKAFQAGQVEPMEPVIVDGLVSALQSLGEFVTTMTAMLRGITEVDEAYLDSFMEGARDE